MCCNNPHNPNNPATYGDKHPPKKHISDGFWKKYGRGGRPRVWDRKEIIEGLIVWAQNDDSINLNEFCSIAGIDACRLLEMANRDPEISQAYRYAKTYLACRRELKLSTGDLHVKAYDLNANVYDLLTKNEHRDNIKFETAQNKDVGDNAEANNALDAAVQAVQALRNKPKG